jgi:hypothetical protein
MVGCLAEDLQHYVEDSSWAGSAPPCYTKPENAARLLFYTLTSASAPALRHPSSPAPPQTRSRASTASLSHQRSESLLLEMVVSGQGIRYLLLAHDRH